MPELDNPAARVYFWLQRADKQGTQNEAAMRLWCKVWGLDESDHADKSECFRRGLALIEAGVEARLLAEELLETSKMASVGLQHYDQVEKTLQWFAALGSANYQSFFQHIGDNGWSSLRVLEALLSENRPEGWLDDTEQESLLDQARSLVDAVLESDDLTEEDKKQIVAALRRVEETLIRAHISGGAEIERAVEGMIGNLFRVIMRRGREMIDHPITKRVLALATAVSIALDVGADYTQIASTLGLALPPPGDVEGPPSS